MKPLKDGIIRLDSKRGKLFGFESSKYVGYLWKTGNAIYVSFIISKKRGNFRELVRRIHELGLTVKVPTPIRANGRDTYQEWIQENRGTI